ncbi:MAG: hypothetical protein CSB19_02205 [Clostridiales bacterium]|nr:MAG: hypothetical protein CSB19_02205 [Clostridiales bacterium]
MRRIVVLLLIVALLSGCANQPVDNTIKEKSVKVLSLSAETHPEMLRYLGVVNPDEIKKYAFLSGGVIEEFFVEVGDVVTAGQVLASLQRDKLSISLDNAGEQLRAARLDYAKAQKNLNYLNDLLADTEQLLAAGATSQQQYDQVKLQRDIAQKELSQAAALTEQAKLQAQFNEDNVDDATLTSGIAGTVLALNYESGEIVAPGYPVVLVRSERSAIHVGVSAEDLKKLSVGDEAHIKLPNGEDKIAEISRINRMPDRGSRTYLVEIAFADDGQLLLGETVDVAFEISKSEGIWLPIAYILNDGLDYVYIVENDRAKRVDVSLEMIYEDKVKVGGLKPQDLKIVGRQDDATEQQPKTGEDDE